MAEHGPAKVGFAGLGESRWVNVTTVAVATLLAGVALRLFAVGRFEPNIDAYWYAVDATTSFSEIWSGTPDGALSRSPVFASLIRLVHLLVGDPALAIDVTSFLVSVGLLFTVLATTWDLWGEWAAVGTTALVAADPLVLALTGWGYTFNAAMIFFTLTLWAIMRSIDEPPFITLAGVFAALAYLTRASLGVFFLIAAGLGVVWRLFVAQTDTDSGPAFDRWYLTGGVIFATTVISWNVRNYLLVGYFSANRGVAEAGTAPLDFPGGYAAILAVQLFYMSAVAAVYGGFFPDEIKESLSRVLESETESGLWTAVLSVVITGAAVAAGFWFFEENPLFRSGHARYAGLAIVPVAWIVLRPKNRTGQASPSLFNRAASAVFFAAMTVLSRAWVLGAGVFQSLRGRKHSTRLAAAVVGLLVVSAGTLVVIAPITTHPARTSALETIETHGEDGDELYVQPDEGRIGARQLRVKPDMVQVWAPGTQLVDSLEGEPEWVIRWEAWPQADNPGYGLVSHHRDADGVEALLISTLAPLGVRNAETFVYHRCPAHGVPVQDASACPAAG